MGTMLMKVGTNYQYMEAHDNCVIIVKREVNIVRNDNITEMTVFYGDITSVIFKPEKLFEQGYLEIKCAGNIYDPEKYINGKNVNPYCIHFADKKIESEAKKFKELIEKKIFEAKSNTNNFSSTADEILKYKQLFDSGVISRAEFEMKKRKLLNS